MELTDYQNQFLSNFFNNCGSIREALDDLGLEYEHYRNWIKDPIFKKQFELTRLEVNGFLSTDNDSLARRLINNLLHNGIIETEEITFTEFNCDDEVIKKTMLSKRRFKISVDAIKTVLSEKSTEHCFNILAERGILDKNIARQLLKTSNEYQQKLQEDFGINKNNDKMNDEKAITIVKKALLGSEEDIQ